MTEEDLLKPLIGDVSERRTAYRLRKSQYDFHTVHAADEQEFLEKGWVRERALKRRVVLRRPKPKERMLEDRVWCLMHGMGYRCGSETAMEGQRELFQTDAPASLAGGLWQLRVLCRL